MDLKPLQGNSNSIITEGAASTAGNLIGVVEKRLGDTALGIGQELSTYETSLLPGSFTPYAKRLAAGLPRFLGGLATVGLTGIDVVRAYQHDQSHGASSFPETRKEIFASSASIAAGFGAGALAGGAAAAATALGAPFIVVGAIGVAGFIGIGYAASKAREWAEGVF